MEKLYKIKNCGLDTSNIQKEVELTGKEFDYIFTSLPANNGDKLSKIFKEENENRVLVVYTDYLDTLDVSLKYHLKELETDYIDYLLIDDSCDFSYINQITPLIETGIIKEVGIKISNQKISVLKLDELKHIINFKAVALDICPLNFNKNVIDWCKTENIKIFGFNTFGGNISSNSLISSFTVPYLLEFAATYSDVVFLSSRNLDKVIVDRDYLMDLVGENTKDIYNLENSIFKLSTSVKTIAQYSVKIDDSLFPCNGWNELFSPEETDIVLGKSTELLTADSDGRDEIESIIDEFISLAIIPKDKKSDLDSLSLLRPQIIRLIKAQRPKSEVMIQRVGEKLFIISVAEPIYEKKWKILNIYRGINIVHYIMYYSDGGMFFQNVKNV